MKRSVLIGSMLLFLLVACGGASGETTDADEDLATSPEDIVGMWTRALEGSATSYYFKDDGTFNLHFSTDPELLENSPHLVGDYWFDGSQLNVRDVEQFRFTTTGMCDGVGVYEVIMLETGNLLFRVVEDECAGRVDNLVGPGLVDLEFRPLRSLP